PTGVTALMAELVAQILDRLLIVGNLLFLGIGVRGEFVDIVARVLLVEGLVRVWVILHLILPELLLEHPEFALVGIELILQFAQARAEILLIVSLRGPSRSFRSRVGGAHSLRAGRVLFGRSYVIVGDIPCRLVLIGLLRFELTGDVTQ